VRFSNLINAIECIKTLNNSVLDESIGPIQVQFANGEIERLGLCPTQVDFPPTKVFVGSIPIEYAEADDLRNLFCEFGEVVDSFILPTNSAGAGDKRRSGFVKMKHREDAVRAISALNIKNEMEVRLAVSKLQRRGDTVSGSPSGPSGCNIFVFHIPCEWSEYHLRQYFGSYGFLVSVTVIRDRATCASKGYGFVSYDNPFSAKAAVAHLNGFLIGGKRLKVQYKRGENNASSVVMTSGG